MYDNGNSIHNKTTKFNSFYSPIQKMLHRKQQETCGSDKWDPFMKWFRLK